MEADLHPFWGELSYSSFTPELKEGRGLGLAWEGQ